jgi:hypothetical protein
VLRFRGDVLDKDARRVGGDGGREDKGAGRERGGHSRLVRLELPDAPRGTLDRTGRSTRVLHLAQVLDSRDGRAG